VAEWDQKVPGWELHDVEGYVVAVRGQGIAFLQAKSAAELHAQVCKHEGTADSRGRQFVDSAAFDQVHQGRWQRYVKYGMHWCIPAGETWFGSEYIDLLARQCASHDEAVRNGDV
jgi:hypothetical protein